MKKYILFDNDGVLVDTEHWYYKAGERALAEIGLPLDRDQYLVDMSQDAGTWAQARAAGVDDRTISRLREVRNAYYQEYLRTEAIEIDGIVEALAELSHHVRMAIVTTSKREDFELAHQGRHIRQYMDFVLARDDYARAKPDPEPYLTALNRFGSPRQEALVVEDSSRGLRSAVAAGIDCAVVYNEFTRSHDFSQARYRIRTLAELKGIILGLSRGSPGQRGPPRQAGPVGAVPSTRPARRAAQAGALVDTRRNVQARNRPLHGHRQERTHTLGQHGSAHINLFLPGQIGRLHSS